ncbi:stage V sporulation protein AE [Terrilactibacillus sp. S3-3]|nr:stage V sporulation protein AE [Terrilactibacillus sp. S3-3]
MTKKVILVTDGDKYAREALELAAEKLGLFCLSQSSGNPSPLSGEAIVRLIHETPADPVLVMFDDSGFAGRGAGEQGMEYVARHPDIDVLGAIAVASKSGNHEWTRVDVSIDQTGELTEFGVDKEGLPDLEMGRIAGDTVYVLDQLSLPILVGIGDIGKMRGIDAVENDVPITTAAIRLILERSGYNQNPIMQKTD